MANLFEPTGDYIEALERARALIGDGAPVEPVEDPTGLIKVTALLVLQNHEALDRVATVQAHLVETLGNLLAVSAAAPAPEISKEEFVDRYVAAFVELMKGGSRSILPPGTSATAWALEAGETAFMDATKRAGGPEAAAEAEFMIMNQDI